MQIGWCSGKTRIDKGMTVIYPLTFTTNRAIRMDSICILSRARDLFIVIAQTVYYYLLI